MFREENVTLDNDERVNNLKKRVKDIITKMPIETYQRCSRCREHKLSYAAVLEEDSDNVDLKLVDIEKMKKIY